MTKIIKNELFQKDDLNFLEADNSQTDRIISSIEDFVYNSLNNLCGPAWDDERERLNNYKTVMSNRKKVSNSISEKIESSKSEMNNYMEDYDKLDDSLIPEIEVKLNEVKNNIASLEYQINSLKESAYSFKNLITFNTQNVLNNINGLSSSLEYYREMYQEISKQKNKLDNLKQADNNAFSKVESSLEDINNYKKYIGSLKA